MSEARKCGSCGAHASEVLCWSCAKKLRHALIGNGDQPGLSWFIARLSEAAYGQARLQSGKERRSRGPAPMPLDVRSSDLLRDIAVSTARWVEAVSGSREFLLPTITCQFLAHNITRVMALDIAPTMLADTLRFNAAALRAINRPPDVYLGPCDAVLDSGDKCGFELRAESDARYVECGRCHALHDVEAIRERLLSRVDDEPQTVMNLLRLLRLLGYDVAQSSLYARMGKVNPRMYLHTDGRRNLRREPGAVALYAFSDALDAMNYGDDESPKHSGTHRSRRRPRRTQQEVLA